MTHDQLYEKLLSLEGSLLGIRESLIRLENLPSQVKDHEIRLRVLEAYTNRTKGAIAIAAVLSGCISGAVVTVLQLLLG